MNIFIVIVMIISVLIVFFQLSVYYKAYKLKGTKINKILKEEGLSDQYEKRILFFHSESCGPCKQMMPDIQGLMKTHSNVLPLDVGVFFNLAKRLSVRATPTTIFINKGQVEKVLLGRQSLKVLETFLNQE